MIFYPHTRPLLLLDGPHAAPSQHYDEYKVCMVVGAGIGLTPCNSILRAVLKYKWRHNQYPNHLHLYWVARHADVKAFQWFIGSVTRLINRAEVDLDSGMLEISQKVTVHIFITSYDASKPAKEINLLEKDVKVGNFSNTHISIMTGLSTYFNANVITYIYFQI